MNDELNPESSNLSNEEKEFEQVLRPNVFSDFKGQDKIVDNLEVFIKAAKQREEALDHVLLHGPPGLGKTTLSYIIANIISSSESAIYGWGQDANRCCW